MSVEVVAVDDGSTDDTWSLLGEACENHPCWRRVQVTHTRPGKRDALEAGMQASQGDTILATDADCMPLHPSWIVRMTAGSRTHWDVRVGVSLPMQRRPRGSLVAFHLADTRGGTSGPTRGGRRGSGVAVFGVWSKHGLDQGHVESNPRHAPCPILPFRRRRLVASASLPCRRTCSGMPRPPRPNRIRMALHLEGLAHPKNKALFRQFPLPVDDLGSARATWAGVGPSRGLRCPQSLCDIRRRVGVVNRGEDAYLRNVLAPRWKACLGRLEDPLGALGGVVSNVVVVEGRNL